MIPTAFSSTYTATTEIYPLSLHDALPILVCGSVPRTGATQALFGCAEPLRTSPGAAHAGEDRKSTRLNSSHPSISYAVSCLKKKSALHESESAPSVLCSAAIATGSSHPTH